MRRKIGVTLALVMAAGLALLAPSLGASTCDPVYVTQAGNVFTVAPTGFDDTANLQCALNEAAALGAGSTVQLLCGTYFTGMIEVTGFEGTFKGEGKDATLIHSLPDLPCGDVLAADLPVLFKFRVSQAKVSDLTFDITDPAPCLEYWYGQELFAVLYATGLSSWETGCEDLPGPSLSGMTVERVGFKGVGNADEGYNVRFGLLLTPECWAQTARLKGDYVLTGSSFEGFEVAVAGGELEGSTVRVGGGPPLKNTTNNVREGILFEDFNDTAIEISYNDIGAYWSNLEAYRAAWYPANPLISTYLVAHNTLRVDYWSDGMWLRDFLADEECGQMLRAEVVGNDFLMDNGGCCGAINGWGGTRNVLVRNNRFTGVTGYGVALGYVSFIDDTGWTLVGNNFHFDYVGLVPVYLGGNSAGCTVVGGKNKFNVWDFGTGNILTGVNNMQGDPPGPPLSEAQQNKLDRMRHVR